LSKLSIISGKSSEKLSKELSKKIKGNFVKSEIRIFPDGESKITLIGKISGKKSIVVQSIYPPVDTNLVQALSLITKAKENSSEVIAVIPYMGYARQDREFLPGEIVTMKVLGKLFKGAGASKIIVVDIHSLIGFKHFSIKTKNVTAIPDLVKYFKEFAKEFNSNYIALDKKRDKKTGKIKITTKNTDEVENRDLILVDDMISTGGSIIKATQFLKKQKCKKIYVACTHALLMNDAEKKIKKAGVTSIISTNTIPGKTSKVDISKIIAKAIM
jgi:ribose-phosphate pyrophosphokinase